MGDKPKQPWWLDALIPGLCLLLVLAVVPIVYNLNHASGTTALDRLAIVVGYVIVILIFFFGFIALIRVWQADLSSLLCEPGENKASMSRFQLLIFTFVVAFSLLLIIVSSSPPKFPDIPGGVLTLLGISASTYAVSKGISKSGKGGDGGSGGGGAGGQDDSNPEADQTVSVEKDAAGRVVTRVHDHPTGQSTITVHDPKTGETTTTVHNPTTVTTTTKVDPPPPTPSAPNTQN